MFATILLATILATQFPGPGHCLSPDGRYSVVWKEPTQDEDHRLLLKSRASGASSLLYTFPRGVEVLWAPDSRHLAITDAHGSDESFIVVVSIGGPEARVVIDTERIQKATSISVTGDHHTYVEAIRWLSSRELLLRVHGYGDEHPKGFKRRFVFRTTGQSIAVAPPGT